jgi:hypothetical protein
MRGSVLHQVNTFGLSGGDGSETIKGQADDDSLEGDDQNDHLAGGHGDDCLGASCTVFPPFATEPGNDTLKSRDHVTGNDYVDGGDNTDTCRIDAGDIVRKLRAVARSTFGDARGGGQGLQRLGR